MGTNTKGLRKGGPGRPKGSRNRLTKAMKEWVREVFESPEWQTNAQLRILAGKAPHLEAHCLQVLLPKTEKHEHSGEIRLPVVIDELHAE